MHSLYYHSVVSEQKGEDDEESRQELRGGISVVILPTLVHYLHHLHFASMMDFGVLLFKYYLYNIKIILQFQRILLLCNEGILCGNI